MCSLKLLDVRSETERWFDWKMGKGQTLYVLRYRTWQDSRLAAFVSSYGQYAGCHLVKEGPRETEQGTLLTF